MWFLWLKVTWCDSACPITGQALQVWFLWLEPVEVTQHNPYYSIQCYSACPVIGEAMQRWFLWPKPLKHTEIFTSVLCFYSVTSPDISGIRIYYSEFPFFCWRFQYISSPPPPPLPHLGGGDVHKSPVYYHVRILICCCFQFYCCHKLKEEVFELCCCHILYLFLGCILLSFSPWYNRTSWLGVKHQLTCRLSMHGKVVDNTVLICNISHS